MQTQTENYFKNEVRAVKKGDMKELLARFITMRVEKKETIEEFMGKPLSNFDWHAITKALTEYEGRKQHPLPFTDEDQKPEGKITKSEKLK